MLKYGYIRNLLMITVVLALSFCRKENSTTITGKWQLKAYHNLAAATIETEPATISRSIIMEFSDNGRLGKMTGHTVTNTVSGAYELLDNQKMITTSFGGTKVGEPAWGNKFWTAIHTANAYERQGNKLFIFFAAGSEKMEFTKK
jgi:heat shock protein HslJ